MNDITDALPVGEHPPFTPLVAAVLSKMAADSASTTNSLLDAYKRQADKAEATLWLVREEIGELLDGRWMPTSHALMAALWPSEKAIDAAMNDRGIG